MMRRSFALTQKINARPTPSSCSRLAKSCAASNKYRMKLLLAMFVACPFHLHAAAYLFDFGTANSAVWQGFTSVTSQHVFANGTAFGWQTNDGLRSQARAYTNFVENKSRGRDE